MRTFRSDTPRMSHPGADLPFLLPRQTKVLMVLDVVESVRLMEQDEDECVQRWHRLVAQTEHQLLPLHGGRLVKSLGDGLMLEFANAQGCIKTAFALQYLNDQDNEARPPSAMVHRPVRARPLLPRRYLAPDQRVRIWQRAASPSGDDGARPHRRRVRRALGPTCQSAADARMSRASFSGEKHACRLHVIRGR